MNGIRTHTLAFLLAWMPLLHGNEPLIQQRDAAIIAKVTQRAGLPAEPDVNPNQGWPNLKGQPSLRYRLDKKVLLFGLNQRGRVISLTGNGPLLPNESFAWLAELSELTFIRIDHNTPTRGSDEDIEDYDGSGIDALRQGKLEYLKIGHGFDDEGMAALARIKSLRTVIMGHSRVTDVGVARLARHPAIEEFSISSQARPNRVTEKCVPTFATMPKLKKLGLHETFLTYDNGLKHLEPLVGQLESLSLRASLVLPSDVSKLKAAHPNLEVETSTPAEILASANSRGVRRWASEEAIAYLTAGNQEPIPPVHTPSPMANDPGNTSSQP